MICLVHEEVAGLFHLGARGTEQQLQSLNDFFGHLCVNHLEVIQRCNLAVKCAVMRSETETRGKKQTSGEKT